MLTRCDHSTSEQDKWFRCTRSRASGFLKCATCNAHAPFVSLEHFFPGSSISEAAGTMLLNGTNLFRSRGTTPSGVQTPRSTVVHGGLEGWAMAWRGYHSELQCCLTPPSRLASHAKLGQMRRTRPPNTASPGDTSECFSCYKWAWCCRYVPATPYSKRANMRAHALATLAA